MAITVKQFSANINNIKKKVIDKVLSSASLRVFAKELEKRIRSRVRVKGGGSANPGEKSEEFEPLRESTIRGRLRLKKRGRLYSGTNPKKSNLTATGRMLNTFKAISKKKAQIVFEVLAKDRAGAVCGHEKGAAKLPKRPFLSPSDKDVNHIKKKIRRKIRDMVDRLL